MRLTHKWLLYQADLPTGLEVSQVWKEASAQRVASKEQRGAACPGTGNWPGRSFYAAYGKE